MNRIIRKVAVLGSGVMGSRIACHFANIGTQVLLLDIIPKELTAKETALGLTLDHSKVRNRIVNDALTTSVKSNPSPLYLKGNKNLITTGNFEDNFEDISSCDWIIEAVVERLDIKKIIFDQVEKHRKTGTIVSTNTSGIPLHLMLTDRSDDFKQNFVGVHFFNPPRYLPLMEMISTKHSSDEVLSFVEEFGSRNLGKVVVSCKDTPAFIANRVGVFGIMSLFHYMNKSELPIETIDLLTGSLIGRPKSATFRTADVVGLDTLVHVANGVRENCPNDEVNHLFKLPSFVQTMMDNSWLGSKTKQGFYKKVKNEKGKSQILSLDLKTLEYVSKRKVKLSAVSKAKSMDNISDRLKYLFKAKDEAGDFYRTIFSELVSYVSNRIPEITDELFKVDEALKAGFGWQHGPFEIWDIIGIDALCEEAEKNELQIADWVLELKSLGISSFYKIESGKKWYFDLNSKEYKEIPGQESKLDLSVLNADKVLYKNSDVTISDLGDKVVHLEFHTKMNTIGGSVLSGINKAIDIAEENYDGLVISNQGQNFSAGANVGMIFMFAVDQELDELDIAVRLFQNTMMRIRTSAIPVVVAPHGLALGGACELCMHADKIVAHAETYIGLVEFGVGLIPGGGGTKEFALRLSDELKDSDIKINTFREKFLTIGQAKVATSAAEAYDLGYFRKGIDEIIVSRAHQLTYAKQAVLQIQAKGYTPKASRKNITVLGQEALGIVYVGAHSMKSGNYISEHDQLISEKLGFVLAGGDLSVPTQVSEQYLLDLERRAFIELCMERKTLERMQSIITTGKVLRN